MPLTTLLASFYGGFGEKMQNDEYPEDTNFKSVFAEALYDVDSIVADPGAYTKEQLAALHSQIVSNLERASNIDGLDHFVRKWC